MGDLCNFMLPPTGSLKTCLYTLKQANFGSNMDKPSHWDTFFNYIFNQTFGFVHI